MSCRVLLGREHAIFADVLAEFCAHVRSAGGWAQAPQGACLAVAGPVDGSVLKFTNSPWEIDANGIKAQLDVSPLHIINDFAAVGYATTTLHPNDYAQLGGGGQSGQTCCGVRAGDWFGRVRRGAVSGAQRCARSRRWSCGLRAGRRSGNRRTQYLVATFWTRVLRAALSGAGILSTYQALAELALREPVHERPEDVYQAAIGGSDTLAMRTLQMFCRFSVPLLEI